MSNENKFEEILENLSNDTEVKAFNNDSYAGWEIKFAIKGFGFGSITLCFDKKNNTLTADCEGMGQERLTEIIEMAAPNIAIAMLNAEDQV